MKMIMKKMFLAVAFCLPIFLSAQTEEGTIIYTEKSKMNIELPDDMKQYAAHIPSGSESKMELTFNKTESLYKQMPKSEAAPDPNEMNGGFQMKIFGSNENSLIYYNREENSKLKTQDLFGKQFLVSSELEKEKWKVTGEQKTIAGYNCLSAESETDDSKVKAWFTPEIAMSIGPGDFQGLPGVILEVNFKQENLDMTIIADEVIFGKPKSEIKEPSKGKKVTAEEFEKIAEKKMEEMQKMYGGEGKRDGEGRRIRIISN